MPNTGRHPPEIRERAVRLVFEHEHEYPSQPIRYTERVADAGEPPASAAAGDSYGQKLSGLVEEGLQLTLIEGGHLPYDLAPFDVAALVRRTVAEVDAESNPVSFLLDVEEGLPNAVGDEQRSWQVLTNLISNAVKYSSRVEPIEVSVSRRGESIRIDIKDRGDGISVAELPHVFEKFYRSHEPQGRKTLGSGLGLWLCSSMVEAQHGRLSATSELGVGSVFSFDLPVS